MKNRRSVRIHGYDYTQPGAYFVTLVVKYRKCIFGDIFSDQIKLNEMGLLVQGEWERLENRFNHIELGDFIVMPNHLHGILVIQETGTGENGINYEPDTKPRAPTHEGFSAPVAGSIPAIVRSYKSSTIRRYRWITRAKDSLWQRSFYEHIIRDDRDWENIHKYIRGNPFNWTLDEENPENNRT